MVMCWVPDCRHYNVRETCRFFKFPAKDLKERNRWINIVGRDKEPGPGAFLCSCHFRDGLRENGPELLLQDCTDSLDAPHPLKKRRYSSTFEQMKVEPEFQIVEEELYPIKQEPLPVDLLDIPEACQTTEDEIKPDVTSIESNLALNKDTDQATKTRSSSPTHTLLRIDNLLLKQQVDELTRKLESMTVPFSIESIETNDSLIHLYTGFANYKIFSGLMDLVKDIKIHYHLGWKVEKLSKANQLLICLMKLRQNFPPGDIAHRFAMSRASVSNIFVSWINALHGYFSTKIIMGCLTGKEKNDNSLPNCFSVISNGCAHCTLEPSGAYNKDSQKKGPDPTRNNCNSWKALIGVASNGLITYISDIYPYSNSDKKIVTHCGILHVLRPGDVILTEKGVFLLDLLPVDNQEDTSTTCEVLKQTEPSSMSRGNVERALRRIKCYNLVKFMPHSILPNRNAILQVTAALTNLSKTLGQEAEHSVNTGEDHSTESTHDIC